MTATATGPLSCARVLGWSAVLKQPWTWTAAHLVLCLARKARCGAVLVQSERICTTPPPELAQAACTRLAQLDFCPSMNSVPIMPGQCSSFAPLLSACLRRQHPAVAELISGMTMCDTCALSAFSTVKASLRCQWWMPLSPLDNFDLMPDHLSAQVRNPRSEQQEGMGAAAALGGRGMGGRGRGRGRARGRGMRR